MHRRVDEASSVLLVLLWREHTSPRKKISRVTPPLNTSNARPARPSVVLSEPPPIPAYSSAGAFGSPLAPLLPPVLPPSPPILDPPSRFSTLAPAQVPRQAAPVGQAGVRGLPPQALPRRRSEKLPLLSVRRGVHPAHHAAGGDGGQLETTRGGRRGGGWGRRRRLRHGPRVVFAARGPEEEGVGAGGGVVVPE